MIIFLTIGGVFLFFIFMIFMIIKIMDKYDNLYAPFGFMLIMVILIGIFIASIQQYFCKV